MENFSGNEEISARMKKIFIADCEQRKENIQNSINTYKKRKETYSSILNRLQTIIKKLEVPIDAPISEVAFFCDAHIVRTNEVLMDLGDNYFAECSSFTAHKIIKKRLKECDNVIKDGLESIKLIDEKLEFTKSLFDDKSKDVVEICEPYDEIAENEFYEKRRQRHQKSELSKNDEDLAHKQAMSRLEELEKAEAENEEISDDEDDDDSKFMEELAKKNIEQKNENEGSDDEKSTNDSINKLLQKPGVSEKEVLRLLEYLKSCDETSSSEEEEEEEENSEEVNEYHENELDSDDFEENIENCPKQVKKSKLKLEGVRFSKNLEKVKTFDKNKAILSNSETSTPVIETKSILKNKTPTPIHPDALKEPKKMTQMTALSFPGMIIEKEPLKIVDCEPSTSKEPEKKKISKFRQRREAGK